MPSFFLISEAEKATKPQQKFQFQRQSRKKSFSLLRHVWVINGFKGHLGLVCVHNVIQSSNIDRKKVRAKGKNNSDTEQSNSQKQLEKISVERPHPQKLGTKTHAHVYHLVNGHRSGRWWMRDVYIVYGLLIIHQEMVCNR